MHKLAIGKRNEFRVWAWLIEEGFDVYPSLVDDKGIDGIVGINGKYFEIQIKSGKNWNNQRGLGEALLSKSLERIYLIFNYTADEVRYFTAQEILDEPEWQDSIRWQMPQIKLPKKILEKYKDHDWDGFLGYLRSEAS
ncbi:hypothetical protein D9M68_342750 [compost metagenome]